MKLFTLPFLLLFAWGITNAQHVMQMPKDHVSPNAELEEISWLAGHWKGKAFGGIAEEIWSPPLGESMMFVFKLVNDNKVSFYEIGYIKQVENTLLMQLKHFDGNLTGWEEKEETIDFQLIKIEEDKIFFEGLTIERMNNNNVKFHVLVDDEGSSQEVTFDYKRV